MWYGVSHSFESRATDDTVLNFKRVWWAEGDPAECQTWAAGRGRGRGAAASRACGVLGARSVGNLWQPAPSWLLRPGNSERRTRTRRPGQGRCGRVRWAQEGGHAHSASEPLGRGPWQPAAGRAVPRRRQRAPRAGGGGAGHFLLTEPVPYTDTSSIKEERLFQLAFQSKVSGLPGSTSQQGRRAWPLRSRSPLVVAGREAREDRRAPQTLPGHTR